MKRANRDAAIRLRRAPQNGSRVSPHSALVRVVALRPSFECEDTILQAFRPTPTCTRFRTSIEMPCMKCGTQMRLALIEPQGPNFDLLTYRCIPCNSGESFLKAM